MATLYPAKSKALPESAGKVLAADWEGTVWPQSPTIRDPYPFYHLPK